MRGNWRKAVKRHNFVICSRDVMYNMMTMVATAMRFIGKAVNKVNPKSSRHKEKNFFSLSFFLLYLYKNGGC